MAPLDPSPARDSALETAQRRAAWKALDQSSIMSVELLSALAVWGGAGWFADRWLGTEPWLLATGVLLGFVLGLYLIWLRAAQMDAQEVKAQHEG